MLRFANSWKHSSELGDIFIYLLQLGCYQVAVVIFVTNNVILLNLKKE